MNWAYEYLHRKRIAIIALKLYSFYTEKGDTSPPVRKHTYIHTYDILFFTIMTLISFVPFWASSLRVWTHATYRPEWQERKEVRTRTKEFIFLRVLQKKGFCVWQRKAKKTHTKTHIYKNIYVYIYMSWFYLEHYSGHFIIAFYPTKLPVYPF